LEAWLKWWNDSMLEALGLSPRKEGREREERGRGKEKKGNGGACL
jgi:hypothetical protein